MRPVSIVMGSIVKGSIVKGSIVKGSIVKGSIVKGSIVKGSIVKGSIVKGSIVKGSIVKGSIVKGRIVTGRIVAPRVVIAVAGTSIALGGCFTTSTDYQHDAEDFILTDDDLATSLGTADDPLVFDSATCEKPVDQNVGTTFPCAAIDENGAVWEFSAEIGSGGTYEVIVARDPRTQRD